MSIKQFDIQAQGSARRDLGPNCLQRLSADDKISIVRADLKKKCSKFFLTRTIVFVSSQEIKGKMIHVDQAVKPGAEGGGRGGRGGFRGGRGGDFRGGFRGGRGGSVILSYSSASYISTLLSLE